MGKKTKPKVYVLSKSQKASILMQTKIELQKLYAGVSSLPIHCNVSMCGLIRDLTIRYFAANGYHKPNDFDIFVYFPELKPKWYKLRTWWYKGYWWKTGTKTELSRKAFDNAIAVRVEHLDKTINKLKV